MGWAMVAHLLPLRADTLSTSSNYNVYLPTCQQINTVCFFWQISLVNDSYACWHCYQDHSRYYLQCRDIKGGGGGGR